MVEAKMLGKLECVVEISPASLTRYGKTMEFSHGENTPLGSRCGCLERTSHFPRCSSNGSRSPATYDNHDGYDSYELPSLVFPVQLKTEYPGFLSRTIPPCQEVHKICPVGV